jgi:hypothetical protein
MIARAATMNDLPAIMEYSRPACESSPTWAGLGYNSVIWRRTLMSSFKDPTMCVFGAFAGGKCHGILVGMSMPAPWCAGFLASDLVFVADRAGDKLLDLFIEWCDKRKIRRMDMGVSDTGRDEAKDRLFKSKGFGRAGGVYFRINEVAK